MTEVATILATTTTKPNGTGTVAPIKLDEELLLFDPLNEQLVIVPKEAVKDFLVEAGNMSALCTALTHAKDQVIDAEQALGKIQAQQFPAHTAEDQAKKKLADSEKAYDAAYEAVKKELGDKGYLAGGGNGKNLLELVPLARRPPGQKSKHWAAKWTYVRWDQIKPKIRTEKLNAADKSQAKSFVKNGRIDTHALSKQMSAVSPKLKSEWVLWQDGGFLAPNLQAWAETLNITANEKDPVQFSAGVQLFRYFVGCGAGLKWKPTEGKIAANINGKAELMLARGEAAFSCYLPGPEGWAWAITGIKSKKEYVIGAMLFKGELKLEAAAGASVAAELGLEVNYSGDKAAIKGTRKPKRPKNGGGQRKIHVDEPQAQVNAGAEAFGGVKASGGLEGSLQFRDPEQDSKFSAIAAVGPKLELQGGAGAAVNLSIDYRDGKFKIYAKAGLCCGLGVKGELSLEVDAKQLANFLKYVFHALMNSGFEVLEFVTKRGFEAVTQLHVMMAAGVSESYENIFGDWDEFIQILEREERRIALMESVLGNPNMLRFATPEAHGILLYQLTRHGNATYVYPANMGWNAEVLGRRKQAVLTVCRWAQCKSQFENIVQHMNPQGAKGGFKGNLAELLRFMEIGPFNSTLDDELNAIYARLPVEPARGYKVAANHTPTFMAHANMGNAPVYMAMLRELDLPNMGATNLA